MSHIGLVGGSFNPPHVGHLMLSLWVLAAERAERVWLLPCHEHAFGKALESFAHRAGMCRELVALLPRGRAEVCEVERELPGPSRTLKTVIELERRYPEHRFSLVVGADILQELDGWYRSGELLERVGLIVAGRPGFKGPEDAASFVDLSSSEVRSRLARGLDVSGLLPAGVVRYISRHGCFASSAGG